MSQSATGDAATDALVAPLTRLVWAVHTGQYDDIEYALGEAYDVARNERLDWSALAVLLAAMVPVDQAPGDLLGWHVDPPEFVRLVGRGVNSGEAARLLRELHNREGR